MKVEQRWSRPSRVDAVTLAFPAHIIGTLLPRLDEIPQAFLERSAGCQESLWYSLASALFVGRDVFEERLMWITFEHELSGEELETLVANHLFACLRSFEPRHEHKLAGVAWLMSQWFGVVRSGSLVYVEELDEVFEVVSIEGQDYVLTHPKTGEFHNRSRSELTPCSSS